MAIQDGADTDPADAPNSDHRLRAEVEAIADQLCQAVDGRFDFKVSHSSCDPTIEKLQMLLNFMLDSMSRSVRTLEQQSTELQKQVALAEAASTAKADFLANMSHEIRTPLNGIVGLTALLQQTQLGGEQSDLVNGVRLSSDNLLSIINDILDFSKIEAGKLELEEVSFDLYAMILEVAESLAARAAQKDIELIVRYVPKTPKRVVADESRLRQILINLIGNALKFTERGYIMISVNYDLESFQLEVEDTGIGIDEAQREHLFEQFTQADTSTTRKFGGTGLGLAISKSIAETAGGQIGVRPNPAGGSIFWLNLPLRLEADQAPSILPIRGLQQQVPRVLIVDDNAMNRFVLSEQLLNWGIHCEIAKEGQEALTLLQQWQAKNTPFDIAIIDYSMPGMDGISLAKAIQQQPQHKTSLILLSSINNTFTEQQMQQQGFSGYLLKPASPEVIYSMLQVIWAGLDGEMIPPLITKHSLRDGLNKEQASAIAVQHDMKVLVVEDNIVNQKVAKALLERQGCIVYIANNGLEALEKAQQFPVDLILMDMQMPEMNGLEATEALRKSPSEQLQQLPIIALTANATKNDRDLCFAAGMNDYLSKPFRPDDLAKILLQWGPQAQPRTPLVT